MIWTELTITASEQLGCHLADSVDIGVEISLDLAYPGASFNFIPAKS